MKVILTGDRPTGKMHLGHYTGSLQSRVLAQDSFEQFVMIADVQALTDNFENPGKVRDSVIEICLDYLAVGIDPAKTTIFLQSSIPEIAELTLYYMNLVTLSRLLRNPTVKSEISQKNWDFAEDNFAVPAGFVCYPVNQAADITIFGADIVPAGEDQRPMIEQTNEIVRKFNSLYGPVLKEVELKLGTAGRLPGIDGKAKMSKSLNNAIFLSDSNDEIRAKVNKCYTDAKHLRVSDPGQVEGNVVFSYLDAIDPNIQEVTELKEHYIRGGLGDVALKNRLTDVLCEHLTPIRTKRQEWERDLGSVRAIISEGSARAALRAQGTIAKVRAAMGLWGGPIRK